MVGAADFDLVAPVFGPMGPVSWLVYVVVGLAAVYQWFRWKVMQDRWALMPSR